jgi:hypothetical protein
MRKLGRLSNGVARHWFRGTEDRVMQQLLILVRDLATSASSPLAVVLLVFWLFHRALPAATRPGIQPNEAWRCVGVAIAFAFSLVAVLAIIRLLS